MERNIRVLENILKETLEIRFGSDTVEYRDMHREIKQLITHIIEGYLKFENSFTYAIEVEENPNTREGFGHQIKVFKDEQIWFVISRVGNHLQCSHHKGEA